MLEVLERDKVQEYGHRGAANETVSKYLHITLQNYLTSSSSSKMKLHLIKTDFTKCLEHELKYN